MTNRYQRNSILWHSNPSRLCEQSDALPNRRPWTWFSQYSILPTSDTESADAEPISVKTVQRTIKIGTENNKTTKLHLLPREKKRKTVENQNTPHPSTCEATSFFRHYRDLETRSWPLSATSRGRRERHRTSRE